MIDKIKALEAEASPLNMSVEEQQAFFEEMMKYLHPFVSDIDDTPSYIERPELPIIDQDFEESVSRETFFESFHDEVLQNGLNAASPYHLAYIPGGGILHAAYGSFLGAYINKYVGIYLVAPGGVKIETELLRWHARILGYDPDKSSGSLASGGSIANLTAVVAARDAVLTQEEYSKAVVYTTTQAHHCVQKALRIAGFKANQKADEPGNIHYVEMDDQFRLSPAALEKAIRKDRKQGKIPWLVVASAGATNFGSVDQLDEIADITEREKLWLHVDGAYGGYFVLTKFGREKLKGIERSDSVVMDAHKSLFLPYGLGTVMVKNREHLFNSFYYDADYIQDENEKFSPANLSPELTKPFRSLRLWLPLKLLGLKPFRACLDEKLLLIRYVYDELGKIPAIQLINEPELTVFAFRWIPEAIKGDEEAISQFNFRLMQTIVRSGQPFLSGTRYQVDGKERFVIRFVILSFRTHLRHVQNAIRILKETAQRLEEELVVQS